MDPIEFRLKNAVAEGDRVITNPPFSRIGFTEALLKMKDYLNRRDKPEGKNRGTGIACGLWPAFGGACSAQVNVTPDGSVTLLIGSLDLTGTRTSLAQIVAEEFGIAFDLVTVVTGDTDAAPYSEVSAGSKITRQMGIAVRRACQDAKDQLARQAAPLLKVEPTDFSFTHGNVQVNGMPEKSVSLSTLVRNSIGRFGSGPITGRGSVGVHPTAPIFVVQMADVEVDKETGKVKILSYAAAQDVGFAINPSLIEGQIQGAVAQGIGRTLMEEYVFQNGIMQNPNLLDYRIPTAADLPFIDTMLIEVGSGIEPFGARAVGEPPMIPTLAAVANAIHSATGVRLKELPMTPEAVLKTIQAE
jgi:CO/xanthine dehydrogenase Mo-binding subunit